MLIDETARWIWSQIQKGFAELMRPKKKKEPWTTGAKKILERRVPITSWIRNYSKEDAIGDLIAGITIALTQIPQSIAYAALAGLDPQYGLNSAFIGSFIYVFFGKVKEVVIGPSSLMALLTFQYTSNLNVDFVILLTFLTGIVELLMGVFRLGFLVTFISTPVVSGFTTATALIVALSQLKGLFGLNFKAEGMLDTLILLGQNINSIKWGDTILGVICIICLLSLRKLKDVEVGEDVKGRKYIKRALWCIATGRNALTVFLTSIIAMWYFNHDQKPPFATTKNVDSGIPAFIFPPMSTTIGNHTYGFQEMVVELGSGYVIIPIVSILANIAISKAYVVGQVDATQEMLALSYCNIGGAMFQAIPSCGAFSRSAVISASGVRTPLAGLYSAILALFALQYLSPYLRYIPRPTLAAVLIAAVVFLVDWEIYRPLWKSKARMELFTVISTTIVCLFAGVEIGLLFGVLLGLACLILKWAKPNVSVQLLKDNRGDYIIIQPEISAYFPSADYISSIILKEADGNDDEKLPILLNCREIRGTDYTTAKNFMELTKTFKMREQKFAFIDVRHTCQKLWLNAGCKEEHFWLSEEVEERLYGDNGYLTVSGKREDNYTAMVKLRGNSNCKEEKPQIEHQSENERRVHH